MLVLGQPVCVGCSAQPALTLSGMACFHLPCFRQRAVACPFAWTRGTVSHFFSCLFLFSPNIKIPLPRPHQERKRSTLNGQNTPCVVARSRHSGSAGSQQIYLTFRPHTAAGGFFFHYEDERSQRNGCAFPEGGLCQDGGWVHVCVCACMCPSRLALAFLTVDSDPR